MLERRTIFCLTNSLHAESALLHHALSAHSHVGIELPVQRLGECVLRARGLAVTEPVEVANLVWTVVGAVPRSHAAIVDLNVQSVGRVICRVHGTDRLTGSVPALLAHHRHESRVEIRAAIFPALVVSLEANPDHLATARDVCAEPRSIREEFSRLPVSADSWNVVLGVARSHACGTSGAAREIDGHRPSPIRNCA